MAATVGDMLKIKSLLLVSFRSGLRGRAVLQLENISLRHQVMVLERKRRGRPTLTSVDRLLGKLERDVSTVSDHFGPDLDQRNLVSWPETALKQLQTP